MHISDKGCQKAGVDVKKVTSIIKRVSKALKEAEEMGLYLFSAGSTTIIADRSHIVVGHIDVGSDGGDPGIYEDEEGIERLSL